jgi:hypothetical protein
MHLVGQYFGPLPERSAMNPRVVTPSEWADAMNKPIRRLLRTFGCIVSIDDEGRSVAKGTGVFVRFGEHKFVVTARHVVRSRKIVGRRLLLLFAPVGADGLAVSGEQVMPISVPLELQVVAESEPLDVAMLRAPEALTTHPAPQFLDGGKHAEVVTKLRSRWRKYQTESSDLPYLILGFPNFGHLIESFERRTETLSATPLPAYVTQLEEHPWDGHTTPAPQLSVEVDAREQGLEKPIRSARLRRIARKLLHPTRDEPEPLGGFSGGEVAVVGNDGEFLLGIISEGTQLFGSLRIAASCWDDCVRALARSLPSNA